MNARLIFAVWTFALCLPIGNRLLPAAEPVSFSRDIQPLLAKKCFACHGPDEEDRQGDLRLDRREAAVGSAIVPGKAAESELIRRIESTDPEHRMPPPKAGEQLSEIEKQRLRQWIDAGADYAVHWAFVPPQRPAVPVVKDASRVRNPIDPFVIARLATEGLSPSPEADRYTLIRRVSLDLTGLPPTIAEADAFVQDSDPQAYEKLVDRLLKDPAYGERWARVWLDLARYSDTNGYEKDRPRSIWPYRDWVINALNSDMPYDQFSIEQIAGDMLPNATLSQRVATGFHRNTMLNEEGGIDPLEFRFYAMVDRVATTGLVWMGLTTGCGQCHSHKYDPFSQTDYYSLMALLNNADEPDLILPDADADARRRQIETEIAALEQSLPGQFPPAEGEGSEAERRALSFEAAFKTWLAAQREQAVAWSVLPVTHLETNLPRLEVLDDGSIFSTGDITKRDVFRLRFDIGKLNGPITALRLEVLPDDRLPARGPGRCYYEGRQGDFFLSEVIAKAGDTPVKFGSGSRSYGNISIGSGKAEAQNVFDGDGSTGWSTAGQEGKENHLVLNLAEPLPAAGELELQMIFERHFAASLGRFRIAATTETKAVAAKTYPVAVERLLTVPDDQLTEEQRQQLRRQFLYAAPELAEARKPIEQLQAKLPNPVVTLVMEERPSDNPRPTNRHHRGEYLSVREPVEPAVPKMFDPLPTDAPANRLALARWLVSPKNPMAARVAVNRAWQSFFGEGLVRTGGDYGTQSEPPTHPELLDWMAVEFMETGWSMKQLHRLIVTSGTYRQSSVMTPELRLRDPDNRLLARGPRLRLDAELVRDGMLRASGLLSAKMFGPSVYPPQPESVTALAYGNTAWPVSSGEDRYRRSLYTFSKRTAPFAAYAVFDAPSGENCAARRDRSNTPLQALTILNDEMFQEMARALAREGLQMSSSGDRAVATAIFRRVLTRPPTETELALLADSYYPHQLRRVAAGELKANEIAGGDNATPEIAAWTMVARAVMNLDEAVVKP